MNVRLGQMGKLRKKTLKLVQGKLKKKTLNLGQNKKKNHEPQKMRLGSIENYKNMKFRLGQDWKLIKLKIKKL